MGAPVVCSMGEARVQNKAVGQFQITVGIHNTVGTKNTSFLLYYSAILVSMTKNTTLLLPHHRPTKRHSKTLQPTTSSMPTPPHPPHSPFPHPLQTFPHSPSKAPAYVLSSRGYSSSCEA